MPRGGKRKGAGRPKGSARVPKEAALSVQVAVRLAEGEKAELERRAKEAGTTVSKYLRALAFPKV